MVMPEVDGNVMFFPPKSIPGSEARAPQCCVVPSAGWSQTLLAEAQLFVVWEGVRLSSCHSWAQGLLPKQGLYWPSACPGGVAQEPCSPWCHKGCFLSAHHCCSVPVPEQEKPEAGCPLQGSGRCVLCRSTAHSPGLLPVMQAMEASALCSLAQGSSVKGMRGVCAPSWPLVAFSQ